MRKLAYPDNSNFEPKQDEACQWHSEYRIIAMKRGDCITGYRVQYSKYYGMPYLESERDIQNWVNKGTVQYTLEAAREYREFLKRHETKPGNSFDVIE